VDEAFPMPSFSKLQQLESPELELEIDDLETREAFLRLMANLMKGYDKYIIQAQHEQCSELNEIFRSKDFLHQHEKS
jgi:hypothetical protein